MASAFSGSAIRASFLDYANPETTLEKLSESLSLFRLGIVIDLATFAAVMVLPVAYYVLLAPVNRGFALLGLSWRLAEATLMFTLPFYSLTVLDLLTGAPYFAYACAARYAAADRVYPRHAGGHNAGIMAGHKRG